MKTVVIDVGKEFSKNPSGRFYSDGEYSAEAFFIHILEDWLSDGYKVELDFSNTFTVGSSFLHQMSLINVNNYYDKDISIIKGDEYGWVRSRWDRYIKEALHIRDNYSSYFLS